MNKIQFITICYYRLQSDNLYEIRPRSWMMLMGWACAPPWWPPKSNGQICCLLEIAQHLSCQAGPVQQTNLPLVLHKAAAEVSQKTCRRGELLWGMGARANPVMDRQAVEALNLPLSLSLALSLITRTRQSLGDGFHFLIGFRSSPRGCRF